MAIVISQRKLDPGDFDAWKRRFEEGSPARKQAGSRGVRRFRSVEDRDVIVVLFDWDSHENFKKFSGMKIAENPRLVDPRGPDGRPKMEILCLEEMPPLES